MAFAASGEPDGLVLPAGFHATVVAEGLGALRHLAVRGNGNIYISTPQTQDPAKNGIIALHLDANHHADQIQHFGSIDGGTGIRFHNDRLYASTPSGVYRFTFRGSELVPSNAPDTCLSRSTRPRTCVLRRRSPLPGSPCLRRRPSV